MIVRVHDGGRHMPGLVRYLVGPGRSNEHTAPHLVAASGPLAEEFAGTEWDAAKAGELAAVLDGAWREARRSAGLTVAGVGRRAGAATEAPDAGGPLDPEHVFHVSLSLHPDEPALSDETWARIAGEYVDAMDFTAAGGKADCAWAAIHHGRSAGGSDHLHLAVCLVREDGTRVSTWRSHLRSRRVVDELERRHGLRPVRDREAERGLPGHHAAEAARAARLDRPEPDRTAVARRLRAAAAGSADEADFARVARSSGLLLRPRFAPGSTTAVTGYSAALRPTAGERPVWYGGARLERPLGLPALRGRWGQDPGVTPPAAAEEWRRANRGWAATPTGTKADRVAGRAGGEADPLDVARAVAAVNTRLDGVDPADRVAWRAAAREAAGVLAAWSLAAEARPGPLARASDSLARAAQPARGEAAAAPLGESMGGPRLTLLARATSKRSSTGWLAVLRQLDRTTQAIHDAQRARGELIAARGTAAAVGAGLAELRTPQPPAAGATTSVGATTEVGRIGRPDLPHGASRPHRQPLIGGHERDDRGRSGRDDGCGR